MVLQITVDSRKALTRAGIDEIAPPNDGEPDQKLTTARIWLDHDPSFAEWLKPPAS